MLASMWVDSVRSAREETDFRDFIQVINGTLSELPTLRLRRQAFRELTRERQNHQIQISTAMLSWEILMHYLSIVDYYFMIRT
jgi:hypothetical protein